MIVFIEYLVRVVGGKLYLLALVLSPKQPHIVGMSIAQARSYFMYISHNYIIEFWCGIHFPQDLRLNSTWEYPLDGSINKTHVFPPPEFNKVNKKFDKHAQWFLH